MRGALGSAAGSSWEGADEAAAISNRAVLDGEVGIGEPALLREARIGRPEGENRISEPVEGLVAPGMVRVEGGVACLTADRRAYCGSACVGGDVVEAVEFGSCAKEVRRDGCVEGGSKGVRRPALSESDGRMVRCPFECELLARKVVCGSMSAGV